MSSLSSQPSTATRFVWEVVKTVVIALAIAVFIRTFLYQPFNIPSGSMRDTLLEGDYLFVSKFSYGYSRHSFPSWPLGTPGFSGRVFEGAPERGDVVVFKYPRDNATDYIKRVIGLPGERIQMKAGVLHINGVPAQMERVEDFLETDANGNVVRRIPKFRETLPGGVAHYVLDERANGEFDNTPEFLVPPGHYFMMGDNRDNSTDSRVPVAREGVGFVPAENLVGRAEIIFFSTDGSARLWEIWKWPFAVRYTRLLNGVR